MASVVISASVRVIENDGTHKERTGIMAKREALDSREHQSHSELLYVQRNAPSASADLYSSSLSQLRRSRARGLFSTINLPAGSREPFAPGFLVERRVLCSL